MFLLGSALNASGRAAGLRFGSGGAGLPPHPPFPAPPRPRFRRRFFRRAYDFAIKQYFTSNPILFKESHRSKKSTFANKVKIESIFVSSSGKIAKITVYFLSTFMLNLSFAAFLNVSSPLNKLPET